MGSRDGVKEGLEKRVSNGRSILVLETETSRSSNNWTSLVAQWLRIRLPMLGDTGSNPGPGRSHVLGATKPVRHNY